MKMNNTVSVTEGSIIKSPENKMFAFFESIINKIFNRKSGVVSVLRLEGVIGKMSPASSFLTFESLREQIDQAFKHKRLLAVCLVVNSPGGKPVQAELIASYIRTLADEKAVPVYSFIEDVAASGGYWLACAGDEIYASKSSIIGSIGVISSGFGLQKAIEKLGIERRIYTQGENKSILDPFCAEKKEDVKIIKNVQAQIHSHFIAYVKSRRKSRLSQSDAFLFSGEFWPGQSAADFGLIEDIGDLYSVIRQKFGANVEIKYVKRKESFIKKYIGAKSDLVSLVKEQLLYDKFDL